MAATGHNEGTWGVAVAVPGRGEERTHDLPGAVIVVRHEVRVGGKDNFLRVAKVGGDLGALGAGLLTGAAVAVGVVLLQKWDTNSSADAVWRASVETAADIPGFSPGDHSLRGMDLSGKQLEDADLRGADLRGVELRDTNLAGAYLDGADFRGDIMYSANLDNTTLAGADFSNTSVMGVQFVGADWKHVKSFVGAQADAFTCWPPGFLESPLAKGIIPEPHGSAPASLGSEANSSGTCPPA